MKTGSLTSIFLACTLTLTGCPSSNGSDPSQERLYDVPFAYENGEFRKVQRVVSERDLRFEADLAPTDQFSSGRFFQKAAREYMVPNEYHNQFALYEHEALVFDMILVPLNLEPADFEISVLINFVPVKFELHLVEEGADYPAMESDNSGLMGESSEPVYAAKMPMRADTENMYTLVIKPEDIPSKGALDVRVIVAALDLAGSLATRQIRESDLSFSVTVYREGADFPSLESIALKQESTRQHRPVTDLLGFMSAGLSQSALIIDYMLEGRFQDLDVGGVLAYGGEEILALHYVYGGGTEPVQTLSGFRLNGEWIDDWVSYPVNPRPNGPIGENDTASVRTIKLDPDQLGEGRLEFIAFERPFQDQGEIDEFQQLIEQSNVLFLE